MGQSTSKDVKEVTGLEEEPKSGVSLAPSLEATILRDFSNQELQNQWDAFRASTLQRRDERIQQRAAALEATRLKTQMHEAERVPRETAVNEKWDALQARFADGSVALEYDSNRLSEKYGMSEEEINSARDVDNEKALPCLGERAHWLDCAKKYVHDTTPCDAYLSALERCVVNETIKKTTSI